MSVVIKRLTNFFSGGPEHRYFYHRLDEFAIN